VSTDRLQALSDGVFAIAMTLLVLELPLPEHSEDLAHDLIEQWPFYAAYVVSFATLAIIWINHHALLGRVAHTDRTLMELNLFLLLFVALVPWPTGLIATYLRDGSQGAAAGVTYGIVLGLMSLAFALIWLWLARAEHLLHPDLKPRLSVAIRRSLVGPAAYASGALVSLVSAPLAFVLYASVAVFFAMSRRSAQ
jgi:uncharacterized membrane protein